MLTATYTHAHIQKSTMWAHKFASLLYHNLATIGLYKLNRIRYI